MGPKHNRKRLVAAAIAFIGLAGGSAAVHASTFGEVATATGAPTFPVITPTCTVSPCNIALDAGTGSVTVADTVNTAQTIPFYGFNVNGANGGAHTLAGGGTSTIKVPEGTTLNITLTQSSVGGAIDLSFPSLPADDVVDNGGGSYTVVASKVGTSVFQPGSNADAPKQVAMGLVGVLIVTPAGCTDTVNLMCGYADTPYTDETIVATTDLDAEFAANPLTFDMGYFGQPSNPDGSARAVYHVINGQSFPATQMIDVSANDSLLIRSVNAGVSDKSLSLLGLRQSLLARNSSKYDDPQTFIAPLVGPGETADLVVTIPGTALVGQQYALIDAGRQMNHGNAYGFGGALTFLTVWPAPAPIAVAALAPADRPAGDTTTTTDPGTVGTKTTTTTDPAAAATTTTDPAADVTTTTDPAGAVTTSTTTTDAATATTVAAP